MTSDLLQLESDISSGGQGKENGFMGDNAVQWQLGDRREHASQKAEQPQCKKLSEWPGNSQEVRMAEGAWAWLETSAKL